MRHKVSYKIFGIVCSFLFLLAATISHAQDRDTTECKPRGRWVNNVFHEAWNSIQRNPNDICDDNPEDAVLNARSEDLYMRYSGLIIRHINVSQLNFERTFTDTSNRIKTLASRAAITFHRNTREWVIRHYIFVKENEPLNPYQIADNERYLRTLEFLQDARILVVPVQGTDSIDLLVLTKDVFSIKVVLDNNALNALKVRVSEGNFLGLGQRALVAVMGDQYRSPFLGYETQYTVNNAGGTFVNITLDHNNINNGRSTGLEEEEAWYLRMERPLISPYSHFAGGLEISYNSAINVYKKPDSIFNGYTYNNYDLWAGYNLRIDKLLRKDRTMRDRKFVALRYFQQSFTNLPAEFDHRFDPIYNDKKAVLGEITFFRQDFIKTQYIYGFGITEDVPYGYNVTATGGWWQQNGLNRPYGGFTADHYTARPSGSFCQYYLRTGGFLSDSKLQDASLLIGASYFSKLFFSGTDFKIRQYIRGTYTQLFDQVTYEPLRLGNNYGLRYFGSDSAFGTQRISLQLETSFFTRFKPYGFRMAPFVYTDFALLRQQQVPFNKADIYPGIGGGVRTRNENLIFGTIELKAIWFPRPVTGMSAFQVTLNSDILYKYNTNYVHAPDIIRLNTDEW